MSMVRSGWDDAHEVAWHLIGGFRTEWEYESDKKKAVTDIAGALQEAYKIGMDEALKVGE